MIDTENIIIITINKTGNPRTLKTLLSSSGSVQITEGCLACYLLLQSEEQYSRAISLISQIRASEQTLLQPRKANIQKFILWFDGLQNVFCWNSSRPNQVMPTKNELFFLIKKQICLSPDCTKSIVSWAKTILVRCQGKIEILPCQIFEFAWGELLQKQLQYLEYLYTQEIKRDLGDKIKERVNSYKASIQRRREKIRILNQSYASSISKTIQQKVDKAIKQIQIKKAIKRSIQAKNQQWRVQIDTGLSHKIDALRKRLTVARTIPRGLPNIMNTCFMNSGLQCLLALDDFSLQLTQRFIKSPSSFSDKQLSKAYIRLIYENSSPKGRISESIMYELKRAVASKNSSFEGTAQNDTQMLVLSVLDQLHQEMNIVKQFQYEQVNEKNRKITNQELSTLYSGSWNRMGQSLVSDIFRGQQLVTISCAFCGEDINKSINPFFALQMQIENHSSTAQSIEVIYFAANPLCQPFSYNFQFKNEITIEIIRIQLAKELKLQSENDIEFRLYDEKFKEVELFPHFSLTKYVSRTKSKLYAYKIPQKPLASGWSYYLVTFGHQSQSVNFKPGRYFSLEDRRVIKSSTQDEDLMLYQKVNFPQVPLEDFIVSVSGRNVRLSCLSFVSFSPSEPIPKRISLIKPTTHSSYAQNDDYGLTDCFKLFSRKEILSLQPEEYCPRCQKNRPSNMEITPYKTGKILVIALGRFDHVSGQKINRGVSCPFELDLKPYLKEVSFHNPSNQEYDLYGIVNHMGSFNGGHYTTFCRYQDKWFDANDEYIREVDRRNVETENAYMLFYRRRS